MYVRLSGGINNIRGGRTYFRLQNKDIRHCSEAVKSLEHMNSMSDSDSDVPELVPSSDEEDSKVSKTNAECVDIWLSKNVKFLEKQEHHIHIYSLGPFIMGLESFISKPWFFCLYDAKLLNSKIHKEKTEYTKLSEEEWQNLDIVDVVTKLFVKKMRKRKFLINTLEMVDKIEEFNRGDGIDVKHSIQQAIRYPHIQEAVWEKALSMPHFSNKIQKVKFATLYVCKLCHMMVTSLAREGKDIAEDFKKSVKTKCGGTEKAYDYKDQGNQQYSQQKFHDAIKLYAEAIKADPFNHLCYGNRAQAYQKLEKHYEALADGRRAVLMKPDWIKGYYRYSQAFYHTGKIDMAIAINRKGMRICEKTKNNDKMLSELKDQGNKLQQAKDGVTTDEVLQQIINSDAYRCKQSDIPEEIRDVPGCTKVIHLESALEEWSNKRHNQDASVLLSSDDQDSSEEEPTISYKEAKKRVADSKKKQTKDPEVEKLTLTEGRGKSSKSQRGRHNNKTSDKQSKSSVSQPPVVTTMDKTEKEKVVVVQKNEDSEMQTYLKEGSSAYLNGLGKKAVTSYQKALDLLSYHKPEKFGLDEQDVAVLEYAYGLSEISTGIYKHILDGIERLKNITETHKDCKLAIPYYGLGKAYISLNRFEEAVDPLNKCLRMANTFRLIELTWPGTETKMEESISNELEKQVKQLLTRTKYPPPPDAVCKLHSDKEDSRTVIFYSDPDFKGFVRIICFTSCIIEFHNQCWKDFKSRFGEKTSDKDILEKPCPTPDCMAGIYKIIIFRQDSMQKEITADRTGDKIEHPSLKPRKPQVKLLPSSQEKIEKRKEKKELRKQRKREMKEEDDIMDDIETATSAPKETKPFIYEGTPVINKPVTDTLATAEAEIPVIKKTEESVVTKKSTKKKNKKKKDKSKQVLNVEVNFGDDNEKQLLGEDSITEEESLKTSSTVNHREEKIKLEDFKKVQVNKKDMPSLQFDEIVKNLFSFFEDLLKAHGPLHINDAKITGMLEDFPPDAKVKIDIAGGLSKFLLQSTNFAMHGEIVCMREDAHKASKISKQQSESFASKASKLKPNSDTNQSQKQENPWTNKNKNAKNSEVKEPKSKTSSAKVPVVEADIEYDTVGSVKKKPKVSCMDTLDDFDYHDIPFEKTSNNSKKTVEKSVEYPKIPQNKTEEKPKPLERSVSMDMDAIDDVDLIPVTRKTKKAKKKNRGMDDLDDFDWNISESESFKDNAISDLDSISSKDETSKIIGKEKIDLNNLDDYKVEKSEFKNDLSSSRSSSKSDISERSDLSTEMKTVKQKMPEFKPPNSKSMWPTKERTLNSSPNNFGPIGSPLPSEKFEKNEQSETLSSYSSYSNDKNSSLLLMDTQKAAEREKFRIDSQYVQELTEQVMKDMTFGKSLTENERQELRKQVSHDIWTDFKRTEKKSDKWTSKSNDTGYEYTTNKKSYTEQYMKNFYQKKNTDPTLNPESFAVVTSSNFFYGNGTFSNTVSTSNSGWPKSMSESLAYPGYQSTFTITQTTIGSVSPFQSVSSNVSSYSSATPTVSPFSSAFTPSLVPPVTSKQDYQSPFSLMTSKSDLFGNWSIGTSVTQTSNNLTSVSTQPLNTFPASYTSSVFSNPFQKYQADKSVYAVVETCTVSINTDPYEPLKEEFQRMKKEYELLQMDLTSALTQKQELASHLQEVDHRFKTFELEVGIKTEAFGKERQSMQEKHDMLYLECNHINQQLKQYIEIEKELKSRILKLEEEKQELLKQKSKERQELRNVEDDIKKRHEEYKTICDMEKERATRAEVEVLNLKKQAAVTMLERSKKEAMYHVHHLKGLHKTHQDQGKEVPTQMIKALGFYENIVAKCSETIPKLVGEFEEQITQIQNGKSMADLVPVFVPPPPPVFPQNSPGPETKTLVDEASKTSSSEIPLVKPSVTNMSGLSPISVKTSQPSVSPLAQPRPLAPPPGLPTQSLRQQIPRLANNNVQNTPKNSFEKLLQRLTIIFPQYNRSIFTQLIQQLRQSRGGSLSGLTIDEISQQIIAMVQAHEQKQGKSQTPAPVSKPAFPGPGPVKPAGPPPGLTNSWGDIQSSNKGEELFEEEQDPCVICHEEMTPDTTVKLECHHRFHDECIRKWLKENSTCPNCRIYALLPDEFPTLV